MIISKHTLRRSIIATGYSALGVVVLIATVIVVALARGYTINTETGEITQKSLLIIKSSPSDATVHVAGKRDVTPSRYNIESGVYDVLVEKEGYRDWKKNITLSSFEVQYHDYIKLWPTNIDTTLVQELPGLSLYAISKDSRSAAFVSSDAPATMQVVEFESGKVSSFKLIANASESKLSQIVDVDWSDDSTALLIKEANGSHAVLFWRTGRWVSLSKAIGSIEGEVSFAPNSSEYAIIRSADEVRRIHIEQQVLSGVIVSDYIDVIAQSDSSYWVLESDAISLVNERGEVVREFPHTTKQTDAHMEINSYGGKTRVLISDQRGVSVFELKEDLVLTRISQLQGAFVSQSPTGRFVVARTANEYVVYDLELDQGYEFVLPQNHTYLRWLHDYYLSYVSDGVAFAMEFDGTNAHQIVSSEHYPVSIDENMKRLYYINRSEITGRLTLRAGLVD